VETGFPSENAINAKSWSMFSFLETERAPARQPMKSTEAAVQGGSRFAGGLGADADIAPAAAAD
jgi:hypothetical protein